jgi:NAD(P)-dependent dehydrogenase (short-subunit alcohol dehydrogenase family)
MFDLKNKVALITGAKQGMGKSHAIMLAKQRAKVILTDTNQEECQIIADEIISNGGEAIAFKMDVLSLEEINSVFDKIIEKWGKVDILVNNAGIYKSKEALEMTEADWDQTIDINLKGQFFCAQRAAKEMKKNKGGKIINIASIASGQVGKGVYGASHYTASKGGIIGMTETLAIEWAPLGININVIGPGAINTPMVSSSQIPKEQLDAMLGPIPLKRMGTPEEVSAMVVFLASDEASYITGATFFVDGGWLAS